MKRIPLAAAIALALTRNFGPKDILLSSRNGRMLVLFNKVSGADLRIPPQKPPRKLGNMPKTPHLPRKR